MIGRDDVVNVPCTHCKGTGRDPKKRTRPCPECQGTKHSLMCETCGCMMPCPGTDPNVFDQSHCYGRDYGKEGGLETMEQSYKRMTGNKSVEGMT